MTDKEYEQTLGPMIQAILDCRNALKSYNHTNKITDVSKHHVATIISHILQVLFEISHYPKPDIAKDPYAHYLQVAVNQLRDVWDKESRDAATAYRVHTQMSGFLMRTESPIEEMFIKEMGPLVCAENIEMEVQYTNESPYRLDVAFPKHQVAVELDGHEFHSSKEARQRDAARDRDLTFRGWTVIRFTGSEIYKDAHACASEVLSLIYQLAINQGQQDNSFAKLQALRNDTSDILELDNGPIIVN